MGSIVHQEGAEISPRTPTVDDDDVDPRWLRSRAKLLDAAARLLATGGVEAVTVEAVTRASRVAKTTLYRHFGSATDLLVATFERLVPQVTPPPSTGPVRDQLIELLSRQATLLEEVPIQMTLLAWVSLGPNDISASGSRMSLRAKVITQYRQPFDQLLDSPQAKAELGDFDRALGLSQLIGPLMFGVLTDTRALNRDDCVRIVDDFFATHRPGTSTGRSS